MIYSHFRVRPCEQLEACVAYGRPSTTTNLLDASSWSFIFFLLIRNISSTKLSCSFNMPATALTTTFVFARFVLLIGFSFFLLFCQAFQGQTPFGDFRKGLPLPEIPEHEHVLLQRLRVHINGIFADLNLVIPGLVRIYVFISFPGNIPKLIDKNFFELIFLL